MLTVGGDDDLVVAFRYAWRKKVLYPEPPWPPPIVMPDTTKDLDVWERVLYFPRGEPLDIKFCERCGGPVIAHHDWTKSPPTQEFRCRACHVAYAEVDYSSPLPPPPPLTDEDLLRVIKAVFSTRRPRSFQEAERLSMEVENALVRMGHNRAQTLNRARQLILAMVQGEEVERLRPKCERCGGQLHAAIDLGGTQPPPRFRAQCEKCGTVYS